MREGSSTAPRTPRSGDPRFMIAQRNNLRAPAQSFAPSCAQTHQQQAANAAFGRTLDPGSPFGGVREAVI